MYVYAPGDNSFKYQGPCDRFITMCTHHKTRKDEETEEDIQRTDISLRFPGREARSYFFHNQHAMYFIYAHPVIILLNAKSPVIGLLHVVRAIKPARTKRTRNICKEVISLWVSY
jgi:hypothetical protein